MKQVEQNHTLILSVRSAFYDSTVCPLTIKDAQGQNTPSEFHPVSDAWQKLTQFWHSVKPKIYSYSEQGHLSASRLHGQTLYSGEGHPVDDDHNDGMVTQKKS